MNPYLKRKREQYEALRTSIEGIQTRAAEGDGRDLTEDELTLVRSQGDEAKKLFAEIESLTEIETRNAKVAELAATVADDTKTETRSLGTSNTTAKDRDPGHYRSTTDGGQHSFFSDMYRAKTNGDEAAAVRLEQHNRALSTGSNGPGVVAPHWLTEEFELLARQGRVLPVRSIPLGDDPRPLTLPKQTVGTDAVVAEQASENTPVGGADAWDSDVDTVTPKPTAGKQTVSRQMVDMSTPAIDLLIYGDLMEVYNSKVEAKIGTGLVTAAGAAVVTLASDATNFTATAAYDAVIDAAIAVLNSRKAPADVLAMTVNRWGKFKKLKGTDNRPLIPASTAGPMNAIGVGTVNAMGQIDELGVFASDGIGNGSTYPESFLAYKASDQLLFESNVLRFRFEEVNGPESIVLGVWGYTAFISRQAGKSVKRVQITAA
ncbi:hypothetical protein GCM10009804_03120 [Kribbella hippodromi]|uniref:Phage capsid-like C-terminal domain-containing protein n=1 Tax=Kribbella hippodromi TaxID=434347 RepID=A0ABP4MXE2_9ACTN